MTIPQTVLIDPVETTRDELPGEQWKKTLLQERAYTDGWRSVVEIDGEACLLKPYADFRKMGYEQGCCRWKENDCRRCGQWRV